MGAGGLGAVARVRLSGMRSVVAVVRCASGAREHEVVAAAEEARRALEPVLGPGLRCKFAWLERLQAAVVLFGYDEDEDLSSGVIVWGQAFGADGPASDGQVDRALDRPELHARDLQGRFVLVRFSDDGVAMVSSATTIHTLKRVEGRLGQCWSTHGLTGVVMVGESPELNESAVPEFVVFDYVLGEDELLRGTRSLSDAYVVRIGESGVDEGSYWPREDRLGRSSSTHTSPQDLRRVLRETVVPMCQHPGLVLGLTAGRDSTLLASVLAAANARVDTFTLGEPWWSDPLGAAAVAARLGWPHATVGSPRVRRDWARMVELSAWTEGLLTAADLADPIFDWAARDRIWLSGSGGEIGRMWYGQAHRDADHWFESVRGQVAEEMSSTAVTAFCDRLGRELSVASQIRQGDELDVLYITGRMAKWAARMPPGPHIRDVVAGFLHPEVVACLLNLPAPDRRSGRAFATAQQLEGADLHAVAAEACRVAWPRRDLHRLRFKRVDRRTTRRLATHLSTVAPDSVTRQILGQSWWDRVTARLASDPAVRRQAWNALAVEALADRIS